MNNVKLFFYLQAFICIVTGIKVNMQGSVSLGRDVVETLSHYLGQNLLNGRRTFEPVPIEDPITFIVREAQICKELSLCHDNLHNFLNEYVVILAKAVTSFRTDSELELNSDSYKEEFKESVEDIKNILGEFDTKVDKENEVYYWTHVIKKINARFQKKSHVVGINTVNNNNSAHNKEDTNLRSKIVIATAFIERKYLIKLCSEQNLCSKSHQCTKALNKLLIHFKTMSEDRVRTFVKYVYEALFDSSFYNHICETTANEFQIILNDMSYANDTPARDIMLSVEKTVKARLDMIEMNKATVVAHDILVAHAILSDIDHMYNNRTDAFTKFLNKFYDWLASDVSLSKAVHSVISDISTQISIFDEDLVHKLIDEVTVFLEMTVIAEDV